MIQIQRNHLFNSPFYFSDFHISPYSYSFFLLLLLLSSCTTLVPPLNHLILYQAAILLMTTASTRSSPPPVAGEVAVTGSGALSAAFVKKGLQALSVIKVSM